MDGSTKQFGATQSVYHRFLQPAYERMIIQHVYRNKINLKSGALGELLQKRPKTTGKYDHCMFEIYLKISNNAMLCMVKPKAHVASGTRFSPC